MDRDQIERTKDLFAELIDILEEKAYYADISYRDDREMRVRKDNTEVSISDDRDRGVKMRAFDGEQFHERCLPGLDDQALREAAMDLRDSIITVDDPLALKTGDPVERDFVERGEIEVREVTTEDKVERLKEVHGQLWDRLEEAVNLTVVYLEEDEFRIFVSRDKKLSQSLSCCTLITVPYVKAHDGTTRDHYQVAFEHGWEVANIDEDFITRCVTFADNVRKAKRITPGRYTTVIAPKVAGLVAHESFGHGMEADMVYKGRARAGDYIGKRIAPENVSIIENPSRKGTHGFFFFDDEGMVAEPTYLLKNGVVQDPITDMLSATLLDCRRSANGRSESYDRKNYARMSATYFDKGDMPVDEMVSSVDDGLYLHYGMGGMEDPKGWGIQVQGILAERIERGKLTGEFYYQCTMTGYLPEVLGNIKAVGDELTVPGTGICGKGHKEWVRVAEGGSHLLIEGVELS